MLKSLKKMDLRRSEKLKVFPDLSKATNLEELCLEDCCSLVMIPSSIRNLKKLRELDMKRCEKLRSLPTNIDLESLHSLNFSGCSKLRSFPRISRNISHLFLDDTDIKRVPGWIENISGAQSPIDEGLQQIRTYIPKHFETEGVIHFSIRRISAINDDMLASGDVLATELVHGIRESRIAIVVLSNNYASSSWCLDELVEIIKCSDEIGQEVIPVYYGVEPAHIRTQILDLGKASKKGYTVDNYKQQKWVEALTVLDQHKGYYFTHW